MIQKQGNWVPFELKPRNLERRFFMCEQLLQKWKGFLHCIINGDEKHYYIYDTLRQSKAKKIGVSPIMHQYPRQSRATDGSKLKFYIWWDPDVVPSNYHLFRSITHGLSEQKFSSYEDTKKWVDSWIALKNTDFFQRGLRMLP